MLRIRLPKADTARRASTCGSYCGKIKSGGWRNNWARLLEGLNSGDPIEITPEYWEKKRQAIMERHKPKARKR